MVGLGCWAEEVVSRVGCHVGGSEEMRYLCGGVDCFMKLCMWKSGDLVDDASNGRRVN